MIQPVKGEFIMKRFFSAIFIVIIIIIVAVSSVYAQVSTEKRFITVTGEAEVKVIPNEVIISLGIDTNNKILSKAKADNDMIIKKVFSLTESTGIDPIYVQTSQINIEPRYRYYDNIKNFEGYFVSKTIMITLKDLSKFDTVLSGVLEAGVNNVNQIQFKTTELKKYREKARIMAINAAYEKAKILSGELNQKVGKPYSIEENSSRYYDYYRMNDFRQNISQNSSQDGGSGMTEGTLAPGMINITSSVTVRFELE